MNKAIFIDKDGTLILDVPYNVNPMRYSSLPLAVIEAMTIGMPIVALATTELPTIIENGVHGYISCNPNELIERMLYLIQHPDEASRMGDNARKLALSRFGLEHFKADRERVLQERVSAVASTVQVA